MSPSSSCLALALGSLATILGAVSPAAGEPKRHVLDFSGQGSAFVVKEPPGWFADSTIARAFGADVIFYPVTGDPHSPGTPLVRVLVMTKASTDTGAELNHYVNAFRSRYRNFALRDGSATHPHYRAYSKGFCVQGKFCEYVTYLNPGQSSNLLLLVTLHRRGHSVASSELTAYQRVVASLEAN
ncbi:MAG: hypothetical protein H6Q33_4500 [Deltaproteobacteria bacterium]|nr:hypothetical protein [Deltaproteobacteria bacterium]